MTEGRPLPEGHASSTARAEEIIVKPSVAENVQKGAESTMTRQQLLPGKQRFLPGRLPQVLHLFLLLSLALIASPDFSIGLRLPFLCYSRALSCAAPQANELELLEVMADLGMAATDEAVEIAAAEG